MALALEITMLEALERPFNVPLTSYGPKTIRFFHYRENILWP